MSSAIKVHTSLVRRPRIFFKKSAVLGIEVLGFDCFRLLGFDRETSVFQGKYCLSNTKSALPINIMIDFL